MLNNLKTVVTPIRSQTAVRLSSRQIEILGLLSDGRSSQEVADLLFLSKRTIDFHIASIFERLRVKNRMHAIRVARKLGMLPFEPWALVANSI